MRRLVILAAAAVIAMIGAGHGGAATLSGPSPYLCFNAATAPAGCGTSDSPFKSLSFGYFHLETFEDHLFNVPGVTASVGGVTSVVFGPSVHDSVDADDGTIDGSGLLGDSFFASSGATGISFTFSGAALGSLPTDVGLVWTDGAGSVTFQAFGPGDVLLAACTSSGAITPDGTFGGTTAEDRFVGCSDPGGISRIFISNSSGGIEIDHLQYGAVAATPPPTPGIPAPASLVLLGGGLLSAVAMARRFRR